MSAKVQVIALLGLGTMIFALSRAAAAAPSSIKTPQDVHELAAILINRHGFNVSPCMATAIAIIESGDINNPANGFNVYASRYEPGIGDVSTGLMQTLSQTALWLSTIGYTAYGTPDAAKLYNPEVSLYFGLAYLDWLSRYRNTSRPEDWVVQSYNAGPGHSSSQYLAKYFKAKVWLRNAGLC